MFDLLIHSFHICFSSGRVAAGKQPQEVRNTSYLQQSLIALLLPHQNRTKQSLRHNHTTSSFVDIWAVCCGVGVASMTRIANLSWVFWSLGHTIVAGIFGFGKLGRHSRFYEFHCSALCHDVSRSEIFAKMSSLLLVLEIAVFQSINKIHEHRWRLEHRPIWKPTALRWLNVPILWTWNNKAHLILCLLYQYVY